jgi:hypothetical protein
LEIMAQTFAPSGNEIAVAVSGGPNRQRFAFQGQSLTQDQLGEVLNAIPGVRFARSCPGGCDFLIIPNEVQDASDSAKKRAGSRAEVVTLNEFIDQILSPAQQEALHDEFGSEKSANNSPPRQVATVSHTPSRATYYKPTPLHYPNTGYDETGPAAQEQIYYPQTAYQRQYVPIAPASSFTPQQPTRSKFSKQQQQPPYQGYFSNAATSFQPPPSQYFNRRTSAYARQSSTVQPSVFAFELGEAVNEAIKERIRDELAAVYGDQFADNWIATHFLDLARMVANIDINTGRVLFGQ